MKTKKQIKTLRIEYENILEQFPEGVIIVDNQNDLILMNTELMSFLQVNKENQQDGLKLKMFGKYLIDEGFNEIINSQIDNNLCLSQILEDKDIKSGHTGLYKL